MACNICLRNDLNAVELPEDSEKSVYTKSLLVVFGIKIGQSTNLPFRLCPMCLKDLKTCHDFFILVQRNVKHFAEVKDEVKEEQEGVNIKTKKRRVQIVTEEAKHRLEEKKFQFFGSNCYKCQKPHTTYQNLRQHLLDNHKVKRLIYVCCGLKIHPSNQSSHMSQHIGQLECHGCHKKFNFNGIKVHLTVCRVTSPCPHCHLPLRGADYTQHSTDFHPSLPDIYVCDICKKTFTQKTKLTNHVRKHRQYQEAVCDICGQVFTRDSNMIRHRKTAHEMPQRTKCPICHRMVKFLQVHMNLQHDNLGTFVCDACGKTFINHRLLFYHRTHAHKQAPRNTAKRSGAEYTCKICGESLKNQKSFEDHVVGHPNAPKLYKCEYCDFEVNYQRNMWGHVKKKHPKEFAEKSTENEVRRREKLSKVIETKQEFIE